MVDITDDLTIDTQLIEAAISEKTKVIFPVDIGGWPCNYNRINEIVRKKGIIEKFKAESEKQISLGRILVIADAAHSLGAKYHGSLVGSLTDITIFSLHAVKNITTAEGGAICICLPYPFDINDEYRLMKLYTLNGQNKDAYQKLKTGGWKYDILFPGLKVNLPDVCASIGLAQIRKYNSQILVDRKSVALRYQRNLKNYKFFQLPPLQDDNIESSYHLYALRINDISEIERDAIIDDVIQSGVSVNVHFIPLPMLTAFKKLGYDTNDYPIAYRNYSREISLPIYPQLSEAETDYICEVVISAYNKIIG